MTKNEINEFFDWVDALLAFRSLMSDVKLHYGTMRLQKKPNVLSLVRRFNGDLIDKPFINVSVKSDEIRFGFFHLSIRNDDNLIQLLNKYNINVMISVATVGFKDLEDAKQFLTEVVDVAYLNTVN